MVDAIARPTHHFGLRLSCGNFGDMTDEKTIEYYNQSAGVYVKCLSSQGTPDRHLQAFIDAVIPSGRVLDLGAGPGNSTKMMQDAGLKAEAWDASHAFVDMAIEAGVPARQALFSDLSVESAYDGIFANFSLLHAPREEMNDHLNRIAAALTPGGVFHIGMKVGEAAERDRLGRFYTYYGVQELVDLVEARGLGVFDRDTFQVRGMTDAMEPAVILLARKPDA